MLQNLILFSISVSLLASINYLGYNIKNNTELNQTNKNSTLGYINKDIQINYSELDEQFANTVYFAQIRFM